MEVRFCFCPLFWYGMQFDCSILRSVTAALWFMCARVQVSHKSLSGWQCSHPQAMRGHWMTWIRGWITRQSWRLSQKPQVQVLIQWVILWPCLRQTNSHTENLGPSYSCVGALLCSWFSVQTIMKLLFMSSCAYCGYLMQQGPHSSQTGYSVYKPTLGRFVLQRRVRADFMWLFFFLHLNVCKVI